MKMKRMSIKNLSVQEAFEQFQQFNKVKNLSPATIHFYKMYFAPFANFCGDTGQAVSSISQSDVEAYTLFLRSKESISGTTVNIHIRGIRAFLYFCMERDYMPSFKIKQIKVDTPVKEPYTERELELILKKPDMKACTFAQYRNWVIANFFLGTGCRASTLINIRIEDLRLADGVVVFRHTKNRSQQVLPLSKTLVQVLEEYLTYRYGDADGHLFITSFGKPLTVDTAEQCIQNHNRSRGVEKTSLHLFRHTYAKLYIMAGGDPFRLQKLLGHSDLAMTKRYVALYADDLKENYDKTNPLEQMSRGNGEFKRLR